MSSREYLKNPQMIWQWRSLRAILVTMAFASMATAPIHIYEKLVHYPWVLAIVILLILLWVGITEAYRRLPGRILATITLMMWTICSIVNISDQPGRGLFLLITLIFLTAYMWPNWRLLGPHSVGNEGPEREDLLIATVAALLIGIDKWQTSQNEFIVQTVALSLTFAVPAIRAFKFVPKRGKLSRVFFYAMGVLCVVLAFAPVISNREIDRFFYHLTLTPIGLFSPILVAIGIGWPFFFRWIAPAIGAWRAEEERGTRLRAQKTLIDATLTNPARVLVISFVFICASGTAFLHLPLSSTSSTPISWIVSAFTSVSATCVTGLTVINPVEDLTGFGQVVLLSLIQIGGLGMMVFSSAAIMLLGGRLSLSQERAAVDMVGATSRSDLWETMKTVFIVTAVTEIAAALILFGCFLYEGEPFWFSLWKGVFTAISAFCNAGFALQGDSLVGYNQNFIIINTIALTIAIGGFGPPVVMAVLFWKDIERRTLHARLVIIATLVLIIIPALLILLFEWDRSLAEFGMLDKFSNALFQSVTLRTAGFNSIDLTQMRPISWTVMEVVMFIGGSPGSTAGGIKTTTLMVILLGIVAVVKGEERIKVFGRTIPNVTVLRASAIVTLGVVFFFCALTAIQLTQTMDLQTSMFEIVSAMATVGLSLDGTSQLDEIGMVIIMACMFAGRVGPISLFVFFASSDRRRELKRYPEEDIPVG